MDRADGWKAKAQAQQPIWLVSEWEWAGICSGADGKNEEKGMFTPDKMWQNVYLNAIGDALNTLLCYASIATAALGRCLINTVRLYTLLLIGLQL